MAYKFETIYGCDQSGLRNVNSLLNENGLKLDPFIEKTFGLFDQEKLIATGSIGEGVLKSIAVDQAYQGSGVINILISNLLDQAALMGYTDISIITKMKYEETFQHLGFHAVLKTDDIILMENQAPRFKTYLLNLEKAKKTGDRIAAIVMNGNPFTLGHRYLIEKAAGENEWVHVFAVSENKSLFSSDVRHSLIKKGVRDLENVVVHIGGPYIVSSLTFPSYFAKSKEEADRFYITLDLELFGRYIAKALGITRRYVGEEVYCQTTRRYNAAMHQILPKHGIEVVEIPRLAKETGYISASKIREALKNDDWHFVKENVPPVTYEYLTSDEARPIIERIKGSNSRH